MRVEELINEELIKLNCQINDKGEVIEYMAKLIHSDRRLNCNYDCNDKEICEDYLNFKKSLFDREIQFPTAIGYGFAIPHGKCNHVKNGCLSYISLQKEIQWDEEESVKNIFMIGFSSEASSNQHIELLVKLSKAIMDEDFKTEIKNAGKSSELLNILIKYMQNTVI